jgi:proteic killer suppression protein
MTMNQIILTKKAQKQIKKVPTHIRGNFQLWVRTVEKCGIKETRKIKGFHDEPLSGKRLDQRSIRLSNAYRAFYIEHKDKIVIEVIEVNKHEY